MGQYAALKRNSILYPASTCEFSKSIAALKTEIKALIADNAAAKATYLQAAIEVAIDMQSALADWKLAKVVTRKAIAAASEDLLAFAAFNGAEASAIEAAKAEILAISQSATKAMCDEYREGKLNTVWGHDYCSGLDHSLRRGARWVTSNPCKVQQFKGDFPELYGELVKEINAQVPTATPEEKTSWMFAKVVGISARALRPIYEATNKEYGFVCLQVDPRNIRDTQAMIDQVHYWQAAMSEELGTDDPNVVYKIPAVEAALPAVKVLLEEGYKLCITLNFSISQHTAFAELLKKGQHQGYLVCMAGQLDDKIAAELEAKGVADAGVIARHGSEAVMRKSYNMLAAKGYSNVSIMSAAVRGPWHIQNSMAPADGAPFLITTVTKEINKFDADPTPFASVIDQPVEEKYMEVLKTSKVFMQAYTDLDEGMLKWDDLFEYPPFVGFFNNFTAAYQEIVDDFKA